MLKRYAAVLILLAMFIPCGMLINAYMFDIIPRHIWAVETLKKNVDANREAWRACKRFRVC